MAYNKLSTANLPNPGIDPAQNKLPAKYFDTFLYTGNGAGLQVGDVIKKPADTTTIAQSVYMDDGTYLDSGSITAATDAERRTWALSCWIKRNSSNQGAYLLNQTDRDGSGAEISYTLLGINGGGADTIIFADRPASANDYKLTSSQKILPDGMWHHLLFHRDSTTQANNKLWIDGVEAEVTQNGSFVTNQLSSLGSATGGTSYNTMRYGRNRFAGTDYNFADYYLAEVHFVQGSLPSIDTFGEFDANGIWLPKAVTGLTYGTHGHYFTFADNTSFGDDTSGNTFDFTGTNFATTDQVDDSPTNNFATLNSPSSSNITYSEGNLKYQHTGSWTTAEAYSTIKIPAAQKFYFEVYQDSVGGAGTYCGVGITSNITTSTTPYNGVGGWVYLNTGAINHDSTTLSTESSYTTGDTIGVAVDRENGTVSFYKEDTLEYTVSDSDIATGDLYFTVFAYTGTMTTNFGQRSFTYTPPSGYLALSEDNITVDKTNMESPDFVWGKNRDASTVHVLIDSVRGTDKYLVLGGTSGTDAEGTTPNILTDFNANGFTLGSNGALNTAGNDYVAWTWKANGSGVSNNVGSIPSTVSANTESGFSIVTYTGNGSTSNQTVGHGLGIAPSMVITKAREANSLNNWPTWHKSLNANSLVYLNSTTGQVPETGWMPTLPSSSVIYLGTGNTSRELTNNSGVDYVSYVFADVEGFSKFGSYTGNGSDDGPFVYTGFKPAFVMTKRTNSTNNWVMVDIARSPQNVNDNILYASLPNNEVADATIDFDLVSNGFKLRSGVAGNNNTIGSSYIYIAFAENPFKYSNAR